VPALVGHQVALLRGGIGAVSHVADKGPVPSVHAGVRLEVAALGGGKGAAREGANVGQLASVLALVATGRGGGEGGKRG
jgi:hypothetical protein